MVDDARAPLLRRVRQLEYVTIAWNSLEGVVSVAAGLVAGSVSLTGFGIDSFIEVVSGAAILWRVARDVDPCQREQAERRALRVVGACLLALAVYVAVGAARSLWLREPAESSPVGVVIAAAAVVVMPLLGRAKRRVSRALSSGALHADSRQADFCAWLSAILLVGLLLRAWLGWWWADPAAALLMAPIIAKEGVDGLRARACCHCG
jgi:divalent metal cation (Fe/Co/Zn/Cd) transporter